MRQPVIVSIASQGARPSRSERRTFRPTTLTHRQRRTLAIGTGAIGASILLAAPLPGRSAEADPAGLPPADATVIVTGTRSVGKLAWESATPVDIISSADLAATGQTNLLDALLHILPSFNAQAVGYDFGALARTFQLRGLSPSQTLVLVNGKPRHLSASLYSDSDSGAQGSNVVDLDFIPLSLIDRVEVLGDGATSQYGSGAIAGVINVVLKHDASGGNASVLAGGYFDGGGSTTQVDLDKGFAFDGGSLHVSAGYRSHGFSNRSGETGGPQPARVQGDPLSVVGGLGFDLRVALGPSMSAYGFGTIGRRRAFAYENPRQPGDTGVPAVDALFPDGFSPRERIDEADYSLTAGVKGQSGAAWAWDLSATGGRDDARLGIDRTVNPVLYGETGNAQERFRVGDLSASEYTLDLDAKRSHAPFTADISGTLAFGLQVRHETYAIGPGEPDSYLLGGSAGFQGFRTEDQTDVARDSVAGYLELEAHVSPSWEVGVATRAEHYDGVGDHLAGKLTTRYDVSPRVAVRGSVGNGFHAPSLAQQYYSNTGVSQTQAYVQLAPGSPGGRLLGAPPLRPELSRDVTAGLVLTPWTDTHLSLDGYQIDIDDRIINTAQLNNSQLGVDAVEANGVVLPAGVDASNTYVSFFTNGVDTRTRGVDFALDTRTAPAPGTLARWVLGVGYNSTRIRHVHPAPGVLVAAGLSLVGPEQQTDLTTAAPRWKASLAGTFTRGRWEATLRETFYGRTAQVQGYGPYYEYETRAALITNVDLACRFAGGWKLEAGANNLFNQYPGKVPAAVYRTITYNYDQYSHATPYGINGGYYYVRLAKAF